MTIARFELIPWGARRFGQSFAILFVAGFAVWGYLRPDIWIDVDVDRRFEHKAAARFGIRIASALTLPLRFGGAAYLLGHCLGLLIFTESANIKVCSEVAAVRRNLGFRARLALGDSERLHKLKVRSTR